MRISDWSSDVCSSVYCHEDRKDDRELLGQKRHSDRDAGEQCIEPSPAHQPVEENHQGSDRDATSRADAHDPAHLMLQPGRFGLDRSEEHTSELQSLMRISYAVFCLKKKKKSDKRVQQDTLITTTDRIQTTINTLQAIK